MSQDGIEVLDEHGYVLVRATDKAGMTHRWWFDETDAGRLVFVSEVVQYKEDAHPEMTAGRHYMDEHKAEIPARVEKALAAEDFTTIVDTNGKIL